MADDTKSSSQLPVASFAAIAVFVAGVLLGPEHGLTPTRPPSQHAKHDHQRHIQDIPARLWEDPFAATTLEPLPIELVGSLAGQYRWIMAQEASRSKADTGSVGRAHPMSSRAVDGKTRLQEFRMHATSLQVCTWFMPVMVNGGPYGEDSEHRRRKRYAVVSALQRSGFVPEDNEHLGYFETGLANGAMSQPLRVPFESYTLESKSAAPTRCARPDRVIVLWLDEDAFQSRPISNLASVMSRLTDGHPPHLERVVLIGPVMSQTLRSMLHEIRGDGGAENWPPALPKLEIFASSATASNSELGFDNGETPVSLAASRNITLHRPIVDDQRVMARMFEELKLRGVNPGKERIAFVSESDTPYGRRLSDVLHATAETVRTTNATNPANAGSPGNCIGSPDESPLEFHYLRGLDGETARAASNNQGEQSETTKETKKQAERPSAGLHQLDYAQRVARTIRARHDALRGCRSRIAAIGLLGHDFYDKALLIQALKKEMPTALLFTTDLDARMADANQVQWTRNLLVASGFGLQLHPRLQRSVAPFRDSYQTAAYFSTLIAVRAYLSDAPSDIGFKPANDDHIEQWLSKVMQPRVYEIGRREILDLGPGPSSQQACNPEVWIQCASVSPPPSDFGVPGWDTLAAIAAAIAILLMTTSRLVWNGVTHAVHRRWPAAAGAIVLLILVSAFSAVVLKDGLQGEPFRWAQGVSAWPTLILRSIALMLILYFLCILWNENSLAIERLAQKYYGNAMQRPSQAGPSSATNLRNLLVAALRGKSEWPTFLEHVRDVLADIRTRMVAAWRSPILIDKWRAQEIKDDAVSSTVINEYSAMSRNWRRAIRVGIAAVAYLVVCIGLLELFDKPNEPFRGIAILRLHHVILYSLILGYTIVLFLTVDTVRLFSAFIDRISSVKSDCPVESLAERLQVAPEILDQYGREWMNIQFIAERAERLNRIVY